MYLLIDNYDSFTYNLKALFESVGAKVYIIKNDEYIDADSFKGIILSPGPSNPANSGTTLKYLKLYTDKKPFFGVCLGMQAICYSLGYNFRKAKSIMHGKIDKIVIKKKDVLFKDFPDEINAVRYHSLVMEIPEKYITSISTSDNEAMSFEMPNRMLFGVQFHPESYLSEYGAILVKNFIDFCEKRGGINGTCKKSQ